MKRSDDKSCNCGNQVFGKAKVIIYVKASVWFSHSIGIVVI